jgi:predicted metalloprotease with PDZ domain
MLVSRLDTNRWAIANAPALDHVSYKVNDTYDEPAAGGIFEPSGTNIETGENVVMNTFGFVGYFDDRKDIPYEFTVIKPKEFYGATSLKRAWSEAQQDIFYAKNYFELHDCPILYAKPDTTSLQVANARVMVAVYSPSGNMSSAEVMKEVEDVFLASAEYLGGVLPVDRYNILLYLAGMGSGSGGFGALEHNTSTLFVLPDAPISALSQTIKDVTAHEFFHIVTPLNIHSEQIHNYDFIRPQMSQHLWLYEGCTEYAAHHVQVKHGLMSLDDYLEVMRGKMVAASNYDTGIAFTELSKKALDEHASQYGNVYQQGALIGMAVDLKLRDLSDGAYGIQALMSDMSAEYGVDRPFEDDALFKEIARISGYPEMESFLNRHIAMAEPIPFDSLLESVGIQYAPEVTEMVVSGGNVGFGYNPRREKVVILGTDRMDAFGQALGLRSGDELVSWNGVEINMDNIKTVMRDFKRDTEPGKKVKVVVNRRDDEGNYKVVKLKAKAELVEQKRKDVLVPVESPTEAQLRLRKSWINI